jgi:hypothetical protein
MWICYMVAMWRKGGDYEQVGLSGMLFGFGVVGRGVVLEGKWILGGGYYGHGLTMEAGIVLELVPCHYDRGDGQQKR